MPSNFGRAGMVLQTIPMNITIPQTGLKPIRYSVTGVTMDANGVPLAGCILNVYETISSGNTGEPKGRLVNTGVSDANGNYSMDVNSKSNVTFQVEAVNSDNTVQGVTVNTLVAIIS